MAPLRPMDRDILTRERLRVRSAGDPGENVFEARSNNGPVVFPCGSRRGSAKVLAPRLVLQQFDDTVREVRGVVGKHNILAITYVETFGTDCGGNNGFAHGHGLEDL